MQDLRLPEGFLRLKDEQQAGALVALQQVDEAQRQAVLDEWAARCRNSAVRNPAGYLFGIVQKAIGGEFKALAGQGDARAMSGTASAVSKATGPELVQADITRLRSMLERPCRRHIAPSSTDGCNRSLPIDPDRARKSLPDACPRIHFCVL